MKREAWPPVRGSAWLRALFSRGDSTLFLIPEEEEGNACQIIFYQVTLFFYLHTLQRKTYRRESFCVGGRRE